MAGVRGKAAVLAMPLAHRPLRRAELGMSDAEEEPLKAALSVLSVQDEELRRHPSLALKREYIYIYIYIYSL